MKCTIKFFIISGILALNACTNSPFSSSSRSLLKGVNLDTGSTGNYKYTLSTVNYTEPTGTGNASGSFRINIDPSVSPSIQGDCTTESCACKLEWGQVTTTGSTSGYIPRKIQIAASQVDPYSVLCSFQSNSGFGTLVADQEIPEGTSLSVSIVSTTGNSALTLKPLNWRWMDPAGGTDSAAFRDQDNGIYNNILRYSCYETAKRGVTVANAILTETLSEATPTKVDAPLASKLCPHTLQTASSNGQESAPHCATRPEKVFSSNAATYNLYIRDSIKSSIVEKNSRYSCYKVSTSGGATDFFPLDQQFALRQSPNAVFSVPVEAPSILGLDGVEETKKYFCNQSASASSSNELSTRCLGYAAQPNSLGQCEPLQIINQNNQLETIPMTALRRYVYNYPTAFDSDGDVLSNSTQNTVRGGAAPEPTAADIIYVADRVVGGGPSTDPLKPVTALGPKPCPAAQLDFTGALRLNPKTAYNSIEVAGYEAPTGRPAYISVNTTEWDEAGYNIDGVALPNYDFYDPLNPDRNSCSAAIALPINSSTDMIALGTSHSSNSHSFDLRLAGGSRPHSVKLDRIFIRPQGAIFPHYHEDRSFMACVPASSVVKYPPLHFSKGNATAGLTEASPRYCAETLPTQNGNPAAIDHPIDDPTTHPGYVVPFTSHVVKGVSNGSACTASTPALPSSYPNTTSTLNSCTTSNQLEFNWRTTGTDLTHHVGVARHPQWYTADHKTDASAPQTRINLCGDVTCDRTVASIAENTHNENGYPLLAYAMHVEELLQKDPSYACQISEDFGGGKSGRKTPSSGCCAPGILDSRLLPGVARVGGDDAHLEPDVSCGTPTY